jgi:limonene-1,2-epoxide hydrolase
MRPPLALLHWFSPQYDRDMTMSNYETISSFCDTWASRDIDALMAFFADDAVYHNIPMDPANVGKEQIRAVIEMFMKDPDAVTFEVHHQAESPDGVVLNERTDTFHIGDHQIQLRVMGTFELVDGKITAWRDYFDMNQYMSQLPQQG